MIKTYYGYYIDSVRTSGEVIKMFIRDKEVICKLILFIEDKNTTFFIKSGRLCVF
ncbi:MAG: hypothetical protein RLZZ323_541 [Bacteroidota bacterium]|jgi:hypothetical protein